VAFDPKGTFAYVAELGSDLVDQINVASGQVTTATSVPGGPIGVAISPDGSTAWVVTKCGGDIASCDTGSVDAVNIASPAPFPIAADIPVGSTPQGGIAITPDGKTVYVSNDGDGTVSPIDIASMTAGTPIPVGGSPIGIALG
jgi:YVTN family beta-propeller protein